MQGGSLSCGCVAVTAVVVRLTKHGASVGKDGQPTPEYAAWGSMIARCTNPNRDFWQDYGGRGITVHPAWQQDFSAFFADVGARPSPKHTLDRINNSGNYEPGNVRWATPSEQQRNRRNSRILTLGERSMCVAAWAELLGVRRGTLSERLRKGWPIERVLSEAVRPKTVRSPP